MRIAPVFFVAGWMCALAIVPATAQRGKDDPNRLVCRSLLKTGTLAGRERQCFTREQWERIAQAANQRGVEMQEYLRGRLCGDPSSGRCD